MRRNHRFAHALAMLGFLMAGSTPQVLADGVVIDKVYHPYVEPLERELEWRVTTQDSQPGVGDDLWLHRLAFGQAIAERWFGEIYLVGEKSDDESLNLQAYEFELKRQLTEQGEYWADWGLVMELEKRVGEDVWEAGAGLLMEKEIRNWSLTVNFFLAQEWGADIADEIESSLAVQMRYRHARYLEPALELYSGEDTRGLGPVVLGDWSLGPRRTLHWEAGIIFGLDEASPNQVTRFLLEYEF